MATPAEKERPGSLDRFLSKGEQETVIENATKIAEHILFIGDADYRRQTTEDWKEVQAIRAYNPDGATERLKDIIGSSNHTLLGKVYATFAFVDLTYAEGYADVAQFFSEATFTEPSTEGDIILLGALYGRVRSWVMQNSNGQYVMEQLDEWFVGKVVDAESAKRKLRIQATANALNNEILEDQFGMRLPAATIAANNESDSESEEVVGIPVPQSIMYLQEGRLATPRKLQESVQYGMPDDKGPGLPTQRLPQLLVGVETTTPPENNDRLSKHIGKTVYLYYIALRALRRSQRNFSWISALRVESGVYFNDDKLLQYCSFDSLSFATAVRIVREFTRLTDKDKNTPITNLNWMNIYGAIDRWTSGYTPRMDTRFNNEMSILETALAESQRIDGTREWGPVQALVHIKSQIAGLVVKEISKWGDVTLRTEGELWALYLQHAIDDELTDGDKLEMAKVLLSDRSDRLWDSIQRECGSNCMSAVDTWVRGKGQLPEDVAKLLLIRAAHRLVIRSETIRDTHIAPLPQPLPPDQDVEM